MTGWAVEVRRGRAHDLHHLELPAARSVWLLEVTAPAIVLGSTQGDDAVDRDAAAAAGIDVARRRSGGGAVWVAEPDLTWIDVVVPRNDPLWDDDVGRSAHWLGACWQRALAAVAGVEATVHRGPLVRTAHSGLVCFAGIGAGEVLVGDAKVVGISQRRTRAAARFQCAVPRRWHPEPLATFAGLLRPRPAPEALATVAHTVDLEAQSLLQSLVTVLMEGSP